MTGAAHTVRIKANLNRVQATFAGQVIADTGHALTVLESGLDPVQYFPRQDVQMELLSPTPRRTRCPFKGEASYYTLTLHDQIAENAVWSYEDPIHDVLALKGYLAFYPNKVDVNQVSPGDDSVEPHHHV